MTEYNFDLKKKIKSNKQGSESILSDNKTAGEKCHHVTHTQ